MKQKENEAANYARGCSKYDGFNPIFDRYDAKETRESGFLRDYESAIEWINIKKEQPENCAHCFIKKREQNDSEHWQWNYSIAEFIAPILKNQVPVFRVYDMTIRLEDVTHWILIPED